MATKKRGEQLEMAHEALDVAHMANERVDFEVGLKVASAHALLSIAESLEKLTACISKDNEGFAYRVFMRAPK